VKDRFTPSAGTQPWRTWTVSPNATAPTTLAK
jgi:hypothetical protein